LYTHRSTIAQRAWGSIACHPKASAWYILPAYKIWRLSSQPFRGYDCGRRNWKYVTWP